MENIRLIDMRNEYLKMNFIILILIVIIMETTSKVNEQNSKIVDSLKKKGVIKTPAIENAMREVDRGEFIWDQIEKELTYIDRPMSIGTFGNII